MKIEGIIQSINIPAVRGQVEGTANNNVGTSGKAANGKAESLGALNIDHSIREGPKDKQQNIDKQSASTGSGLFDLKAVFALDKDKNVVIRFLDKKGKIVRQIPPEEYIKMVKKFKENVESFFSNKV